MENASHYCMDIDGDGMPLKVEQHEEEVIMSIQCEDEQVIPDHI